MKRWISMASEGLGRERTKEKIRVLIALEFDAALMLSRMDLAWSLMQG